MNHIDDRVFVAFVVAIAAEVTDSLWRFFANFLVALVALVLFDKLADRRRRRKGDDDDE